MQVNTSHVCRRIFTAKQQKRAFSFHLRGVKFVVAGWLGLLLAKPVVAQTKVYLAPRVDAQEAAATLRPYRFRTEHPDSAAAAKTAEDLLRQLQRDGFLAASIDSLQLASDTLVPYFHVGAHYRWAWLRPGNVPEVWLTKAGFRERFYQQMPFRGPQLARLEEALLRLAESNGYPFATLRLDSLQLQEDQLHATLHYEPGPIITFDSARVQGDVKIKSKFMARYLRIQPGDLYDQRRVETARRLLQQLPYLRELRAPTVTFSAGEARPYFFVEPRRVNQIDGIVGFLPNQRSGKLLINGQFTLELYNLFNAGKELKAHWQSTKPQSQLLDLAYVHPVLFGSLLELGANFYLLKEDSTFLNQQTQLALGYPLRQAGKLSFYTLRQRSRNNQAVATSTDPSLIPEVASFDLNSYGLAYERRSLDDLLYPHRGWLLTTQTAVGNKRIRPTATTEAWFDSIDPQSFQLQVRLRAERYSSLKSRLVLLTRVQGGALFNKNLFLNDLYRLGGLATLRGFNENFFYASRYAVGTAEVRFFTDDSSYLLVFFDQGWGQFRSPGSATPFFDFPLGAGAGLSFRTAAGIFNFVYSMGYSRAQAQAFAPSQSKIHFGLLSRF